MRLIKDHSIVTADDLSRLSRLMPDTAVIYLRYEEDSERAEQFFSEEILDQALCQLESNGIRIVRIITEISAGHIIPNTWGSEFIAGPLGSPLARAISAHPKTIGLGEDLNGQLLVAASMSGIVGFYAPRPVCSLGRGRLSFLGHNIRDVRQLWLDSLSIDDEAVRLYKADNNNFEQQSPIALIVPRVHLAKSTIWDTVHFDVRTNYALAIREFERAGIEVVPTEDIVTEICRNAATLVSQNPHILAERNKVHDLHILYKLPLTDEIFVLPTSALPAPRIAEWPLLPGRYDPDPFETIMPVVLSDSVAITIPNGFSAEGLPTGLTVAGPAQSSARLFALAEWFQKATTWPTVPKPR